MRALYRYRYVLSLLAHDEGLQGQPPQKKQNLQFFFVGSPAFTRALGYCECLRRARVCKCCRDKTANMARSIVVVCVVSSYYDIYAFILLYICPHTSTCVSAGRGAAGANRQICLAQYSSCVLILLHMCPPATVYVCSDYSTCVRILLHVCPHATVYVSSCYCICVLRARDCTGKTAKMPRSTFVICVLILLYFCPHATVCIYVLRVRDCMGTMASMLPCIFVWPTVAPSIKAGMKQREKGPRVS